MIAPRPRAEPGIGHLGRWGIDPLGLIEEGARLGPVFEVRLWRSALIGYSPAWNKFVLGDLPTFHSRKSMSALSPYLGAGIVNTDAPEHGPARRALAPTFNRRAIEQLSETVREVIAAEMPEGEFDAIEWSARIARRILSVVMLGHEGPNPVLDSFLEPLDQRLPAPFLPRPIRFRRMDAAITRAHATAPAEAMIHGFDLDDPAEVRVALAAGYDTTAHTLAWLLAYRSTHPQFATSQWHESFVDEVLRLHPAGWVGSRRASSATSFEGLRIPRGQLVMYSPYLTHRDPQLWDEPTTFAPQRFADAGLPAWGYIPFAAGARTCLGRFLALSVLRTALQLLETREVRALEVNGAARAGVTMAPVGPIRLVVSS